MEIFGFDFDTLHNANLYQNNPSIVLELTFLYFIDGRMCGKLPSDLCGPLKRHIGSGKIITQILLR